MNCQEIPHSCNTWGATSSFQQYIPTVNIFKPLQSKVPNYSIISQMADWTSNSTYNVQWFVSYLDMFFNYTDYYGTNWSWSVGKQLECACGLFYGANSAILTKKKKKKSIHYLSGLEEIWTMYVPNTTCRLLPLHLPVKQMVSYIPFAHDILTDGEQGVGNFMLTPESFIKQEQFCHSCHCTTVNKL